MTKLNLLQQNHYLKSLENIDKKEVYNYYIKGWGDSYKEAPNNRNIKKAINQYAYDLGSIDFIFNFGMNTEEEVIKQIQKKLKK